MHKRISAAALVILGVGACHAGEPATSASLSQETTVEVISVDGVLGRDEVVHYGPIGLPVGSTLQAVLSVGSGDADLYVKNWQVPTETDFDCRPYLSGTATEICEVDEGAIVYINVVGYGWTSEYQLSVVVTAEGETCMNGHMDPGEVCDVKPGVCAELDDGWASGTANCLADCSGWDLSTCEPVVPTDPGETTERYFPGDLDYVIGEGEWRHYGPFNTVEGDFRALMGHHPWGHPGSGDADLYVRRGEAPTRDDYDCRSVSDGSMEDCTIEGGGLIYVSIYGYAPEGSRFSFGAYYWANEATVQPTKHAYIGVANQGEWYLFGPYDGSDATVDVILSGRGDTDLYVRRGLRPTETEYDCRPYADGPDERCRLESPGPFWVGVRGYSSSPAYFDVQTAIIAN